MIQMVDMLYKPVGSCCSMFIHTPVLMLYIEIIHLPQTVLSLRCDWSIGEGDPELAVLTLLLDLVRDAHPCLLLLEQERETYSH